MARSADYLHVLTEYAKLAFADPEAWYGDLDFADVALDWSVPGLTGIGDAG